MSRTVARSRWILLSSMLMGSLLWASAGLAQGVAAEIEWRAAPGCPSAEVVRARVASLLARQSAASTRLRATGEIARAAGGDYELTLAVEVDGHSASRTLRGADCGSLSDAAAWLIALAVDPTLADTGQASAPPSPPPVAQPAGPAKKAANETPPASESNAVSPAKPDASNEPDGDAKQPGDEEGDEPEVDGGPATLSYRAGLFGGVYSAGLPAPVGSLGARLGVARGPFYVELAFAHLFTRTTELTGGGSADFTSQLGRARGCLEWGDRLRLAPCAALSLLRTAGGVEGIAVTGNQTTFWLTTGAAVQLALRLRGPLELWLDGGLDLPLSARPRFDVAGLGPVATGNFVSLHTTFGVGVRY